MATTRSTRTLSEAQVEFFEQNGYLVLEGLIGSAQLDHLRLTLAAVINRDPAHRTADFVVDRNSTTALRNINHFTKYWLAGSELVRQPAILGAVRDLIGDDVRFHHTKVFLKPPFEGTAKEWHQDLWSYVDDAENERLLEVGKSLTFRDAPLIAAQTYLTDSNEENGCLRFVPGSHTWGMLDVNRSPERVREDYYPPEQVVKAPARAGSVVLFHCLVLHYSGPNRSATPRWGPIVQYFSPPTAIRLNDADNLPDTPHGELLT